MKEIYKLNPALVWKYFYDFTQIPRPSDHEEKILDYLKAFAVSRGLEHKQDAAGNIVIRKPASAGRENAPAITFQGHVDMVCEKNKDVVFDFSSEPIRAYIDGEWIKAQGTTLGADCGIGCAIMLALLDAEGITHPRLEMLFTVAEETGLTGAFGIGEGMITSKYLVNLDSEDEGEIFVGCAGGIDTVATFAFTPTAVRKENECCLKIMVKGLKGGHSGDAIHKQLGNANILLARFLIGFLDRVQVVGIDGGNLRNAIPREAEALVVTDKGTCAAIMESVAHYQATLRKELFISDAEVMVTAEKSTVCFCRKAIDDKTARSLTTAVLTAQNGVYAMSQDMEGFVETSTNLASIKPADNAIVISTSQRSSVESKKMMLAQIMKLHFETYGASVRQSDGYPGWTPTLGSRLLEVFRQQFAAVTGKEAKVKAIHAGLECGLFLTKYPELEMVSVGPTILNVHSPDEQLRIPAVEETWDWMVAVLKNM